MVSFYNYSWSNLVVHGASPSNCGAPLFWCGPSVKNIASMQPAVTPAVIRVFNDPLMNLDALLEPTAFVEVAIRYYCYFHG
jgi:hypothetical protein